MKKPLEAGVMAMAAAVAICRENDVDPQDMFDVVVNEVLTPGGFAYRPPTAGEPHEGGDVP